jgi:hypothetical protein
LSEDYTVRWFNEDDVDAYIAGLNRALYDEYNEDVFEWKWKLNQATVGFTSIAVIEHKMHGPVAFNSFLPIEIRHKDEVFMALQGCDGFVELEHRRRGLFQKTITFLEEEVEKINAEFLMGFNLVEAAEAARKAGTEMTYNMNKCFLNPRLIRNMSDKNHIRIEPINVTTLHRLYMGWVINSKLFNLNRSIKYLKWRIEKHPFKKTQPYGVYQQDVLIGYLVTDIVSEGEKTTLTINDYNPGLINRGLRGILEKLSILYDDVTVIEIDTLQGGIPQKTVERLGFKITPWYQVIMMALKGTEQREGKVYRKGLKLSNLCNWHLAESDIYYTFWHSFLCILSACNVILNFISTF